jgi:hypothetical protein
MRSLAATLLFATALPLFAADPNPSARQRELIVKLLEVTNASRASTTMMEGVLAHFEKQTVEAVEAQNKGPEAVAEAKEIFESFRTKMLNMDFDGLMRDAYVRIYAKYFTEKELEELIAFYGTPVGKKSIEAMPHLMKESMEAAAQELTPKIEQMTAEVMAEQEKKRPWRRTMSDMRKLSTAIESYASDHDDLYPAGDYDALKGQLEEYIAKFPEKDIWGHPYAYVVSPDRRQFRIVSAGADTIFDWDSRRIVAASDDESDREIRYRERLEDDIVMDDWGFVQLPVQAKKD